jgi:ABC-2 type transport system permease protein
VTDIFFLSVRQLTGKWRVLIMLGLGGLPVLNAVISAAFNDSVSATQVDAVFISGMLLSAVLPLIVLSVSSAAFANEIEDRTLSNLTLTPVPRWTIVAAKLLAAIAVGLPAPLVSGVVSYLILTSGSGAEFGGSAFALAAGVIAGVLVYAAVFLWAGLMTGRALWAGLLYVFLWEGLFSSFVSGVRYMSIRQYAIGIIHGIDKSRFEDTLNVLSMPVAAGMAIVVFAVFIALSIRRLRAMDVP